jgi:hypothetical protein
MSKWHSLSARKLFISFSLLVIFFVDLYLGYLIFQMRLNDGITMGFGFAALLGGFIVFPITLALVFLKLSRTEGIFLAFLVLAFLISLTV